MKHAAIIVAALFATAAPAMANKFDGAPDYMCHTVIANGWPSDRTPEVQDYIQAMPGAETLGFGSECHLSALVFAECFLQPNLSMKQAIDSLVWKATHGKRLLDTQVCGA